MCVTTVHSIGWTMCDTVEVATVIMTAIYRTVYQWSWMNSEQDQMWILQYWTKGHDW